MIYLLKSVEVVIGCICIVLVSVTVMFSQNLQSSNSSRGDANIANSKMVPAAKSDNDLNYPPDNLPVVTKTPASVVVRENYLSSPEFGLSIIISLLTVITLLLQFFLLNKKKDLKSEDILRTFGVVLIIMGTLFVIASGFDTNQIAPAMGLFGTIAGYLLSRETNRETNKEGKDKNEAEEKTNEKQEL
jgi:hypothetical protein